MTAMKAMNALLLALTVAWFLVQSASAQAPARMPNDAELKAAKSAMPNLGALPALPSWPASGPVDVADMARRYEQMQRGQADQGEQQQRQDVTGLLVFVSLGMPRPSLDRLLFDAERSGALLVLRGVRPEGLQATAAEIQGLLGKRKVAWNIDPQLFKTFGVVTVPTTVIVDPKQPVQRSCGASGGQCASPLWASLEGDVTLAWSLERIVQMKPAMRSAAAPYLARLGARP